MPFLLQISQVICTCCAYFNSCLISSFTLCTSCCTSIRILPCPGTGYLGSVSRKRSLSLSFSTSEYETFAVAMKRASLVVMALYLGPSLDSGTVFSIPLNSNCLLLDFPDKVSFSLLALSLPPSLVIADIRFVASHQVLFQIRWVFALHLDSTALSFILIVKTLDYLFHSNQNYPIQGLP